MHEVTRVGVFSIAKLQAAIAVATAAIIGLPILLVMVFIEPVTAVTVYVATLVGTVVVAIAVGAISPLLYNLLAKIVGGVEVELAEK